MTRYDPRQIQKFAEIMYRQAMVTVVVWTLLGLIIGFVCSALIFWGPHRNLGLPPDIGPNVLVTVLTVISGLIGLAIGQGKAFWYRLQAQILLCQAQIEANTRSAVAYPAIQ